VNPAITRFGRVIVVAIAGLLSPSLVAPAFAAAPRLKVSDNRRFLVREDGSPFFYLGDTAWELFHRLNREDADRYLKNRADKRLHRHPGRHPRGDERAQRPQPLRRAGAD